MAQIEIDSHSNEHFSFYFYNEMGRRQKSVKFIKLKYQPVECPFKDNF